MILAIPPALLTAIYLAEYASGRFQAVARPLIDLLAGIPSVVFGVWGCSRWCPLSRARCAGLSRWLGAVPLFRQQQPDGLWRAGRRVVLAVMVFPIIIAVAEDVIRAVPHGLREASLALGATAGRRCARSGPAAGLARGDGRGGPWAFAGIRRDHGGADGGGQRAPGAAARSLTPLPAPALIANNYGEMMSIPLYDAALLGAALILLLIVLIFNILSRLVLIRLVRSARGGEDDDRRLAQDWKKRS
jgi:phosphate transport system permease protein